MCVSASGRGVVPEQRSVIRGVCECVCVCERECEWEYECVGHDLEIQYSVINIRSVYIM